MTSKPTSRWGFLQQAVASVESTLDDILAEGGEQPKRSNTPAQPGKPASARKISSDLSRSNSNASASNDRLQERLARAMAKKTASRPETPVVASDEKSPSLPQLDDLAQTQDVSPISTISKVSDGGMHSVPRASDEVLEASQTVQKILGATPATTDTASERAEGLPPASVNDAQDTKVSDKDMQEDAHDRDPPPEEPSTSVGGGETLRSLEEASSQQKTKPQEEARSYIERIDALQAKLLYLSKQAAESAKQGAASADPGSLEKKLFEKDEKIARLLEEGQTLSKSEMKHLTTIKKMRNQLVASNKEQEAVKLRADEIQQATQIMEDKAKRAEAASKRAEQGLAASSNDCDALRKEREALKATISDMKTRLSKANARIEAAESKEASGSSEKDRKRIAELQDDLTSVKVEREIAEEKLRRDIRDLQAALLREKEQSRAMESEMLGEQAALESKLESFRVRAEEASSADQNHAQAKLLRQVEVLQSQYASASQNWQGIESTLLGRITALEKERDDVVTREIDVRKKLRDSVLKLKANDREVDELQSKSSEMDKAFAETQSENQRLNSKVTQLEAAVAAASKQLEDFKTQSEQELQRRIDDEKTKWTASLHIPRTDSPGTALRKSSTMGLDMNHLMSPVAYERTNSRKSSTMQGFEASTPPRLASTMSFRAMSNGLAMATETPSVVTSMDADEYFANVPPTPLSASQHSHRGVNDLISSSTVAAGPSVQLVERMSANVRRLESEKAASKDELLRITTQRDEAREHVVTLMREVEEKRKLESRLGALEQDHQSLDDRHRTTLELLGERTEQVEELKADIVDVKQMYRQLADTLK